MNEMQIFNNPEFGKIRVIEQDGNPWFVGKDVAEVLGYADTFGAIKKHIDEEDKLLCQIDSAGQKRDVTLINESGLYSLILSSKLPLAKSFKKWVTAEVLPAIRKHGMYAIDKILDNPDLAIAALQKLKEEREKRKDLECLALA